MSKNLIAERDGVMLKVGNEIRQMYKDGGVPEGADADHVQLLVDRGLLVEADVDDAPVEDHGDAEAKPRGRAAKSEGS